MRGGDTSLRASIRVRLGLTHSNGRGAAVLTAPLTQELLEKLHAKAGVSEEQVVAGSTHGAQSQVRIELRDRPHMLEGGDRVLLSIDEKRRHRRDRRKKPDHLIVQAAMLEGKGERLEGALAAIDQDGARQ